MVQGQVFLKRDWRFPYLIFARFTIFHLEIAFPFENFCYVFEEKLFFSVTIILWKKVIP